jgi:hypothetical protein
MAYLQYNQIQGKTAAGTPTQLWHNLLMKILQEQPLMHLPTLQQPLQWIAVLLQP